MLRILPEHIANLIAAGEVVQRPASVVKELMENSVDAGADNIQVIIRDSGKTLIQVIDNGCGISVEDAKIAFLRHATSKISAIEDLSNINTFGFRGEALASIAAVSEVTLRTRREEDQLGYEVKYAESKLVSEKEISTPQGSNFMVRNLFYNIPARRKFLKSDATEYRQILSEFSRIAITRPSLSFRLTHNNTEIYNLSPANYRRRILDVAGREMGRELVNIGLNSPIVKISGYIGRPDDARKTPGHQYLFANNRYFRSSYFHKAVLKAYENLIPDGYLPSYFIFFEVDPQTLDVNIHPAKTEVKFEEENAIFDMLHAVVREALGKNSFFPSIDFDQEGAPEIPAANAKFYVPAPRIDYDPLFNPFNEELKSRRIPLSTEEIDKAFHSPEALGYASGSDTRNPEDDRTFSGIQEDALPYSQGDISSLSVLISGDRYIFTPVRSGVMVINIPRALERIFYERYLKLIENPQTSASSLLFSKTIHVEEHISSLLNEREKELERLGFSFNIADKKMIEITSLPEGIPEDEDELYSLIDSLVFEITESRDTARLILERSAAAMARSAAYRRKERPNELQAKSLIESLFACKEPAYTPTGKICSFTITNDELNKRFL